VKNINNNYVMNKNIDELASILASACRSGACLLRMQLVGKELLVTSLSLEGESLELVVT